MMMMICMSEFFFLAYWGWIILALYCAGGFFLLRGVVFLVVYSVPAVN